MRQAGYAAVHRKGRPVDDEHPRRFEPPHRNALWQLDFMELRVGAERRWLLVIEDDFSRFVVGHVLADGPSSEVVVAARRSGNKDPRMRESIESRSLMDREGSTGSP